MPIMALPEGLIELSATVQDLNGNLSDPAQVSFIVDSIPPEVLFVTPSQDAILDTDIPNIQVDYGDPGLGVDPSTFTIQADGDHPDINCDVGLTSASCAPVTPLPERLHTLSATIRDLAGNLSPVAQVNFSVQLGPGTITITFPETGSVINVNSVLVRGVVEALPDSEVGVTINRFPAELNNGEFAAWAPLQLGTNVISARLVNQAGNSTTESVTVEVQDLQEETLRLLASPSRGVSPLNVKLQALNLVGRRLVRFELDFEGDGVVDLDSDTFDDIRHTYTQEQMLLPTLTVTDDSGNQSIATTSINVFVLPDLVAKWNAMKDALRIGNIDTALGFIAIESRERYREIFNISVPAPATVDSTLTEIRLLGVRGDQAEFEMLRTEDGMELSFYVLFVLDHDGIWRLRTF